MFFVEPHLVVLIQPKQHGQRFRYKCESKSAGSLIAEGSTNEQKVYPTVEVDFPFHVLNVCPWFLSDIHQSIKTNAGDDDLWSSPDSSFFVTIIVIIIILIIN